MLFRHWFTFLFRLVIGVGTGCAGCAQALPNVSRICYFVSHVMFVFLQLSLVNLKKKVVLVSVMSLVYKNVICDRVFGKFSPFEE